MFADIDADIMSLVDERDHHRKRPGLVDTLVGNLDMVVSARA
jgi:hypothetical protein